MRKREYKDATELEDDDDETTDDRLRTNTNEELEMEFHLYMLETWKRMEPALNLLTADNPNVRQRYLTDFDHINIDDTMVLLSPIERATCFLLVFSYPTHDAIHQKLSNYWPIMSESSQISSLLDPRVKFSAFENEIERTNAKIWR
ncbi:hypothetical protein RhiirA4_471691 [Rhizophagus irregularis]|uniref:Uncharacterized protein n=1 Tax=Rhizophagus irregularis TaxID=588596 RepID=A0A2I1H3L9_9GLOM|nr:hypothetical protein RhiirA4_471691 [Rhizophagus irregularis]